VELIVSSLLRSPHGFPTRAGGVSASPFDSLNTSTASGDAVGHVHENLRRLARAAKVEVGALATVSQVHGLVMLKAAGGHGNEVAPPIGEADAIWSSTPGVAVGVKTADCVPLLFEDRRTGAVAAVHAGWRGVIGQIAQQAVTTLCEAGARASELRVAIGPCIQRCCFEVDGDLPARFTEAFGARVVVRPEGHQEGQKVHLDLPWALTRTLEAAGIAAQNVEVRPECTRCDPRFFSHRRDRGLTGRHLSFITCVGAAAL
jgi:YfiH family protein